MARFHIYEGRDKQVRGEKVGAKEKPSLGLYLPGGTGSKVDGDDVRVLGVFFQKCHLNLNLIR